MIERLTGPIGEGIVTASHIGSASGGASGGIAADSLDVAAMSVPRDKLGLSCVMAGKTGKLLTSTRWQ